MKSIAETLLELERGVFINDLSDAHRAVVRAVEDTMRQGTLTVTFKYVLEGPGQVSIACDFNAKPPRMPRGKTLFFPTPEHDLQRTDPRQADLKFKDVERAPSTIREVRS